MFSTISQCSSRTSSDAPSSSLRNISATSSSSSSTSTSSWRTLPLSLSSATRICFTVRTSSSVSRLMSAGSFPISSATRLFTATSLASRWQHTSSSAASTTSSSKGTAAAASAASVCAYRAMCSLGTPPRAAASASSALLADPGTIPVSRSSSRITRAPAAAASLARSSWRKALAAADSGSKSSAQSLDTTHRTPHILMRTTRLVTTRVGEFAVRLRLGSKRRTSRAGRPVSRTSALRGTSSAEVLPSGRMRRSW
mmetsp:Transcript_13299/g.46010  ORF Transcript_13299/g.46010 Transcript_13299/m.46010 type:complete len:255 (+) Transcript_13299:374-1138(+)